MTKMKIQKTCKVCGKTQIITMAKEDHEMWLAGALLQQVAPELTPDERELLISGVCGKCFDEMFSEDEEED